MLWRVMPFEALDQPPGFGGWKRLVELSLAVDEIVPCPDRGPPQSVGRGDQLMCQLAWRALWDGFWTSEVKTMID